MYIVVEAPPDRERMVRIVRQLRRGAFRSMVGLGVFMLVVAGLSIAFDRSDSRFLTTMMVVVGVIFCAMPYLQLRAARKMQPPVNGAWTYTVTDFGIAAQGETMRNEISWAAVIKAREISTDYLLFIGPNQMLPVPRDRMHPQAQAEFGGFLRSRGLLA